ncbi:tryptophan synthase subunit alpha [Actinophytocola sp. KF-1]
MSDHGTGFFTGVPAGGIGLAVFLNAGDPPLPALPELVAALDESGVDCLELAVPFPDSVTDGPVVRRSARRALDAGTTLPDVLACVGRIRAARPRLRIALLADWAHTVRPAGHAEFLRRTADCGADALLVHGLPPLLRAGHHRLAHDLGVPLVTTCYPTSPRATTAESARNATAYLYLVAHRGRTGTTAPGGFGHLAEVLRTLRATTRAPVAVGFGVRDHTDVAALADLGADAAVVGSAAVAVVEHALGTGRDVAGDLTAFTTALRPRQGATPREHHAEREPA